MIHTKILLLILPVTAMIFLISWAFSGNSTQKFLRVRGDMVLDADDNPFFLRGYNIEFKDFQTVLGESDIKRIADTGANSVRLALDYRDFESSPYHYREEGFSLLDAVLEWCERYRIYVILDMHLAPGRQNPHDFVVHREKSYEFWLKKGYQERFYVLWEEFAKRYSARTIVAGYDLLNEGVPPSVELYRRIINTVAGRIRAHDKNHMLIVEEAVLPDWSKELVLIDDKNTIYSIHFFYPPQFSFYATTTERTVTTYPGEMMVSGEAVRENRSAKITGDSDWKMLKMTAAPPEEAEILQVTISSSENRGSVFFDDITLSVDGQPVELPAPLVANNSFEIDYPGFNWNSSGSCVKVSGTNAKSGKYSLLFSDCMLPAISRSSPIAAKGSKYVLDAWYKSEDATGFTFLSLSWHRKKVMATINSEELKNRLLYAREFKARNSVPLYVGEFTAHANPSKSSESNYLNDLLNIFEAEGFHWSFWEYYSSYRGVGIYTGADLQLANQTALDVLERHMKGNAEIK